MDKITPYLALVPLIQSAAGILANLPSIWGVKHPTWWSRAMTFIATAHVIPTPVAPITSVRALKNGITQCGECSALKFAPRKDK